MNKLTIAAAVAAASAAVPASAAAIINFEQVGSSMVVTLSGSLDLEGMTLLSSTPYLRSQNSLIFNNQIAFGPASASGNLMDPYSGMSAPATPFTTTAGGGAATYSGPTMTIFWQTGRLYLPAGYTSGAALSASSTFSGTYKSFGLTEGSSFIYTLPNDTLTFHVGSLAPAPAGVPEPATWALLMLGFGVIGGAMRNRKTAVRVTYA